MRPELNFEAESFGGYNPPEHEAPEHFVHGGWEPATGLTWAGVTAAGRTEERIHGNRIGTTIQGTNPGRCCTLDLASAIFSRISNRLSGRRAACRSSPGVRLRRAVFWTRPRGAPSACFKPSNTCLQPACWMTPPSLHCRLRASRQDSRRGSRKARHRATRQSPARWFSGSS